MIKYITTAGHTFRVWLQETPPGSIMQGPQIQMEVPAQPSVISTRIQSGVEYIRHAPGPSSYGLLGGSFEPNPTGDAFRVELLMQEPLVEWISIFPIPMSQPVYVGLGDGYAKVLLSTFADDAGILGAGLLRIEHSCESRIGSSQIIYQMLAKKLIQCLLISADMSRVNELEQFLS